MHLVDLNGLLFTIIIHYVKVEGGFVDLFRVPANLNDLEDRGKGISCFIPPFT